MLEGVSETSFKALTGRDMSLLQTLKHKFAHIPAWMEQLSAMESSGHKCDIEAIYDTCGISGLGKLFASRIVRDQSI